MKKGIFVKIIPEDSAKVKDVYFSPLKLTFIFFLFLFLLIFFFSVMIFSTWMFSNFSRMRYLENEAKKVKIQEKKIAELEKKLQKFIMFAQKVEAILRPEKKKSKETESYVFKFTDTLNLNKNTTIRKLPFFDLPVKGIISNFFSILHPGIDIVASSGTPVIAPMDGVVIEKGINERFGLYLWIEHKGNIKTFYAHLKEINVKKGEWVKKGEVIGRVGSSGKSTGPHLHFEIWKQGFPLNPLNFTNYSFFALQYKDKY